LLHGKLTPFYSLAAAFTRATKTVQQLLSLNDQEE